MKTILETSRLFLREMTEADYPALAAILQDEQAMYAASI
jgi:RimJ/RimL family protein N-acetyltransferase